MKLHACIALYPLLAGAASTLRLKNEPRFVDDLISEVENSQRVLQDETVSDVALGSIETMKSVQSPDIHRKLEVWSDCPYGAPFIITNINLLDDGKKYFYLWDDNVTPDEPWRFLTNLKFVNPWVNYDHVYADEMGADEALIMLQDRFVKSGKSKIMFYVHGWQGTVVDSWCSGEKFKERSDHFLIPIIWGTDRGLLYAADYAHDRIQVAPNAGITLSKLFKPFFAKIQQPHAWMCHSMGCHVTQVFATEVSEAKDFKNTVRGFDNVFLVAPDVRYDIFNEWPLDSGDDKNECVKGQWNNENDRKRIPDCRLGGGDALVDMSNGAVQVHWNPNDAAGVARITRLKMASMWPISTKGLLSYGNDPEMGGMEQHDRFDNTVDFHKHAEFGMEHSYQYTPGMMNAYDELIVAHTPNPTPADSRRLKVTISHIFCQNADDNDSWDEIYVTLNSKKVWPTENKPTEKKYVYMQKNVGKVFDSHVQTVAESFVIDSPKFCIYNYRQGLNSADEIGCHTWSSSNTPGRPGASYTHFENTGRGKYWLHYTFSYAEYVPPQSCEGYEAPRKYETKKFNSKDRAWSEFSEHTNGPIESVRCYDNKCGVKTLEGKRLGSNDINLGGKKWTAWFSEAGTGKQECGMGSFVEQIECKNRSCGDMRLLCVPFADNSNHAFEPGSVRIESIFIGLQQKVQCGSDWAVVGIKCFGAKCRDISLICQKWGPADTC